MVATVLARWEHRIAPWPGVRSSRQTGHGVRSHRDLGSQIGTHDSVNDTKGRPGDVFPPVRPRSENPLSFRLHAPECPPDRSRKRIKASPRDPALPGGCEGFRHVEPHKPDAVSSYQPAEPRDAGARP